VLLYGDLVDLSELVLSPILRGSHSPNSASFQKLSKRLTFYIIIIAKRKKNGAV